MIEVRASPAKITATLVVAVAMLVWTIPIYSLVVGSMKSLQDVMSSPVFSPPRELDLTTLASVAAELLTPMVNTVAIVLPTSLVATFLGALAAYAIYRRSDRLSDTLMVLVAIATYIPYQATLVPLVNIVKAFNLYNTLPGVILGFMIYYVPMAALLMSIFITVVPKSMIEAGLVDGVSEFTMFTRIVLPVLGPGLVSTMVFLVIQTWNNFFIPLILTRGYEMHVTLKVFSYVGQSGTLYNQMFAAALIASLPTLIIFIVLGRYFVRGLMVIGMGAK
ncbi:carbohydrate ABC transporter permease [Infirmifilum sp. NZ]|uniref:carbohydrate ABC transporter permease n=1 Tax=Infirmifilum sp. NZ TaxID=2926850 RepID=UPI0027A5C44F|nr:carbohydrate ABC transporter permease [Infirmifilum sp. NZ]UNQ73804.1 carbohydrate ABC transporter permease [Infirmifilum sp. NZ]